MNEKNPQHLGELSHAEKETLMTEMLLRSIRVDKNHIGYLKWLLESHDGMATPTTREGTTDVIDFLVAPDFEEEFDEFLEALAGEITVEIVQVPTSPPL